MDFSSSFKKSFKSHNSIKNRRRGYVGRLGEEDQRSEQQPILSDHNNESTSAAMNGHNPEVIVKIDGDDDQPSHASTAGNDNRNIQRDSSLDLWKGDPNNTMQLNFPEDPPSKLIEQFMKKQKVAGEEMALDIDLEMDELRHEHTNNINLHNFPSPTYTNQGFLSPKELRVSFQSQNYSGNIVDIGPDEHERSSHNNGYSSDEDENQKGVHNRRRSSILVGNVDVNNNNNNHSGGDDEGQILRCTSIQRRVGNLGRLKTRSRLIDPPDVPDRRSGLITSNQLRSGMLGKLREDDEDDPLFSEDIPDNYKKDKFDALTIAQWISLVLIVSALVCTLAISKWKRKKLRGLRLWKWEVLVLVLICGRLVSGWWIRIVVFFIERNFFMRKRVLYFVYGVRKAVQNCVWLGLVILAWHLMFDKKVDGNNKFLWYVNKLLICMLMGTLLWLVKTLMVKVLASSFHVSKFFDRIQESLFNQYVIESLSGPPLIEIKNNQEEEDRTMAEVWRLQNAGAALPPDMRPPSFQPTKSGKVVGGGLPPKVPVKGVSFKFSGPLPKNQEGHGISIDQLHKLNHKNVSAWNMKRLMNVVKNGVLSTLDERVLDSSKCDETGTEIKSEYEAIAAARKIFRNVAKPRARFIYIEDLLRFLRDEEALKVFNIVEGSLETEKISKSSLKSWVVNSVRERKALALTLNDTKTAVKKLHQMVNVIVAIIISLLCLIILEIATSKFLLFISSQIVVVAFIFGNTCKTIFEAIIFVFVMHPFDVGDRCEIDGNGVQLIVEEMNILTTVFLRFDNQKILYPNATLATMSIANYYRSPDMGDSIDFSVHIATPAEKIALMKEKITRFIDDKSDHWYPSPTVVLMNFEDFHRLKFSVWLRHRMNHQDMGERWKRREVLVEEMVKIFKELDIEYRMYPLDINVRSIPTPNLTRTPQTWTTLPVN